MKTKEEFFLEYNRDEIMKNLLAAEGHLRNVKPGALADEQGFLSCVVKHLADAEGHGDEAVSHSLAVKGRETSAKFAELRDRIREVRRGIQSGMPPEEALLRVREARRLFESFNPEYDVSRCKVCGPAPEVEELVRRVREAAQPMTMLETEMAERVLRRLSDRYGVEPPRLEVVESCTRPDFGAYGGGSIKVCRGGISLRVLTHEFGHYLQDRLGLPLDEAEAERFSLSIVSEGREAKLGEFGEDRPAQYGRQFAAGALVAVAANVAWRAVPGAEAFRVRALQATSPTGEAEKSPLAFLERYHFGLVSLIAGRYAKRRSGYFDGFGLAMVVSEAASPQPFGIGKTPREMVGNLMLGGLLVSALLISMGRK